MCRLASLSLAPPPLPGWILSCRLAQDTSVGAAREARVLPDRSATFSFSGGGRLLARSEPRDPPPCPHGRCGRHRGSPADTEAFLLSPYTRSAAGIPLASFSAESWQDANVD